MPPYVVTPTPHIYTTDRVNRTMQYVILALTPAAVLGVYYFGLQALSVIVVSIVSSVAFEAAYQKLANKPITVSDCSAVVTGLLLALTLPPAVPLWMPVLGAFAAIVIVKQLFGGLGFNILNPALAGRALLTISYTGPLTSDFTEPLSGWNTPEIITSATPLVLLNDSGLSPDTYDYIAALLGNTSGSIGETSAVALLLGGLLLLATKTITWHIPVSFIATVYVLTALTHPSGMDNSYALYQLLLGGLILGAFFMATDYPTSPISSMGKLVFGVGCGVMTSVIRLYGGFPEGVAYAILFMNLTVPLIDRFIRPRVFGIKKGA